MLVKTWRHPLPNNVDGFATSLRGPIYSLVSLGCFTTSACKLSIVLLEIKNIFYIFRPVAISLWEGKRVSNRGGSIMQVAWYKFWSFGYLVRIKILRVLRVGDWVCIRFMILLWTPWKYPDPRVFSADYQSTCTNLQPEIYVLHSETGFEYENGYY
jgi:hypothetical protein